MRKQPPLDPPLPPRSHVVPNERRVVRFKDGHARQTRCLILGENEIDPHEDQPHLIKGLIRERDVVAIAGVTGVGKTYLGMEMVGAVTAGYDFADFKVKNPGPVLWIAFEGAALVMRRWSVVRKVKVEPYLEQLGEEPTKPMLFFRAPDPPKITDRAGRKAIIDEASALNDRLYRDTSSICG